MSITREPLDSVASLADLHPDIVLALQGLVSNGAVLGALYREDQNAEYGGVVAVVDGVPVRARVGKATPTKVGHFVTVWRRNELAVSVPFRDDESTGGLIVIVRGGGQVGAFSFPVKVLLRRGIVSGEGSSGKRGFRVYAPWVAVPSAQARRTQDWQIEHYQEL